MTARLKKDYEPNFGNCHKCWSQQYNVNPWHELGVTINWHFTTRGKTNPYRKTWMFIIIIYPSKTRDFVNIVSFYCHPYRFKGWYAYYFLWKFNLCLLNSAMRCYENSILICLYWYIFIHYNYNNNYYIHHIDQSQQIWKCCPLPVLQPPGIPVEVCSSEFVQIEQGGDDVTHTFSTAINTEYVEDSKRVQIMVTGKIKLVFCGNDNCLWIHVRSSSNCNNISTAP